MAMIEQQKPIGIFDSGIGGTSIFKEIHQLLPQENIIYLADSKYAPYGNKSQQEIINLCIKNTELLLQKGCKLIVVACNTATTNAIDYLRKNYSIPFIGIEPAIKPAALNSKNKAIAILATKGTLSSELFHKTSGEFASGTKVMEITGKGLVEAIEKGDIEKPSTETLLREMLEPIKNLPIDFLVLGCSHYPYLIPILKKILPENVEIIDSGKAVAKQTKAVLEKLNLLNNSSEESKIIFYSNKNPAILARFIDNFKAEYLNF